MPCMKRVYRDKNASVHWPAARNEKRPSSHRYIADKPRVNRSLRSSVGLRMLSFIRASEETFGTIVSDVLGRKKAGSVLGEPTLGVRSCQVPLRPAALLWAAPNRSARGIPGLTIRQIKPKEVSIKCLNQFLNLIQMKLKFV